MKYSYEDFIEDIKIGRELGLEFYGIHYAIWSTSGVSYISRESDGQIIWSGKSRNELAAKGSIDGKLLSEIFEGIKIIDIA